MDRREVAAHLQAHIALTMEPVEPVFALNGVAFLDRSGDIR